MDEEHEGQEAAGPGKLMAMVREGRLRATREERAKMARALAAERTTFGAGSGRPRTVVHVVGPRGGCRCAECRGRGK